jgi:hypothetical protein
MSLPPYDEALSIEWGTLADRAYADAERTADGGQCIFAMRAAFDYYTGQLSWASSRDKHERELREALGLTPTPPDPGPFVPAPREWRGNLCGVRVDGLPPVPGGAADPSLVLSWFYDRYSPGDRGRIRTTWKACGYTHVLLSWPDSRADGESPESFRATIDELLAEGFFPCVMLCSKDHDPHHDVGGILRHLDPVLAVLVGHVPMVCIGWELSLWLSPTEVQYLIDALAPQFTPAGTRVYVHFQQGYGSFQQPGKTFADFWNLNVGKLTGVLHQKILKQTPDEYRGESGGLVDILERFAGRFNVVTDSGFGHPFDCVACEITAAHQFAGLLNETAGDALGQWAIDTPPVTGPAGTVRVMGSGNGQQTV